MYMHTYVPHEKKLLEIQRVSNPSSKNQRLSTPAYSVVHKLENTLVPNQFTNPTKGFVRFKNLLLKSTKLFLGLYI